MNREPVRANAETYQLPKAARTAVRIIGRDIQAVEPLAIFKDYPSSDA
jgi:hypothetical protein